MYSEFCAHTCTLYQMTLHKLAAFFFVPLASRLVNDDAPTCRSMVAEALKVLIIHVSTNICIVGIISSFYVSVQRVLFLLTPSSLPQTYSEKCHMITIFSCINTLYNFTPP